MTPMAPIVWIPLLVFGVAVLSGLTAVAVQGLAAWRAFRRFRRSLGKGLAETARSLAAVEHNLGRAGEKAAELERARMRLQRAIAAASVLGGGLGEAWALVEGPRSVIPRK